jgi:hypothetical protein
VRLNFSRSVQGTLLNYYKANYPRPPYKLDRAVAHLRQALGEKNSPLLSQPRPPHNLHAGWARPTCLAWQRGQ